MTQDEALAILKTGANIFLTGEPGSGKTHTVRRYVDYLKSLGIEPAITASTGIASSHIGGMTIHSWSGIGIKEYLHEEDLDVLMQNERLSKRVNKTNILIIDEISMLSAHIFTVAELAIRTIRRRNEPFGGMQVVLVGDFFQLPPVKKITNRDDQEATINLLSNEKIETPFFAFQSPVWNSLNPIVCYLSEQHRQEDEKFLEILSAIRSGKVEDKHKIYLKERSNGKSTSITKIFSHNVDVDRINTEELNKIEGEGFEFLMQCDGSPYLFETLKKNCLSPEKLSLKLSARVMFTKNSLDGKYVNGTLGEVVAFSESTGYPIVKTVKNKLIEAEPSEWSIQDGDKVLAKVAQIPLRLAWAITVHKSQGMSLDSAIIDLRSAFEYGQGYVALSRIRSLQGLELVGFNEQSLKVHPVVFEQDGEFRKASEKARIVFGKMKKNELLKIHFNFSKSCGGSSVSLESKKDSNKKKSTYEITKELLGKKLNIIEIAKKRKMTFGTIIEHIEKLKNDNRLDPEVDMVHLKINTKRFEKIKSSFIKLRNKNKDMKLAPVKELLDDSFTYDEIRLARLFIR